jgi:hypothetical protein
MAGILASRSTKSCRRVAAPFLHALNLYHIISRLGSLKHFASLDLVISDRRDRQIHIFQPRRIFLQPAIHPIEPQVKMRPTDLLGPQLHQKLWIKDERRLARQLRTAIAAKLQAQKTAFERMNSFNADTALEPND